MFTDVRLCDSSLSQFQVALLTAGFARNKVIVEGDHFHIRADASRYPCR
jgi:hypothetical protein